MAEIISFIVFLLMIVSLYGHDLYTHHNINRSLINRLKHNQNVETNTLDRLCNILHCRIEDIVEHFPHDNVF